jgi:O-antigen/teichoic acid export membrane protein
VKKSIYANILAQAIALLTQLATIPLTIKFLGIEQAGVWMLIQSILAYIAMGDFGFIGVAKNEVVILREAGQEVEAKITWVTALYMLNVTCALVLVCIFIFCIASDYNLLVTFSSAAAGLVALYMSRYEAGLRIVDLYHEGVAFTAGARLQEWLGGIAGMIFFGTLEALAIGNFLGRFSAFFWVRYVTNKKSISFNLDGIKIDFVKLRAMVRPAFMYLSIPISNSLGLQGVLIGVGASYGGVYVAIFGAHRTASRFLIQITAIFTHSAWPEFTKLWGRSSFSEAMALHKKISIISMVVGILYSAILITIGDWVFLLWTGDANIYDKNLMFASLIASSVIALGHVSKVFLIAINKMSEVSIFALFSGAISASISFFAVEMGGLHGLSYALVVVEVVFLLCLHAAIKINRNSIGGI